MDSNSLSKKPTLSKNNVSLLAGTFYETSVQPKSTESYISAEYRIWIPDEVKTIRGLIVKQHGCGDSAAATGLEHANDIQWQALALKHNFALLGTKLPSGQKPCENWALVNYGSGKAFFKALQTLAKESSHPELNEVPWVLWGHSGGADWAAQIFQQYPERTITMVGVRGGGFLLLGKNPTLSQTPVLFASGKNDPYGYETLDLPKSAFIRYRKIKAPWAFAIESNASHESGNTRLLAIPYLDAIITARLNLKSKQLIPVKQTLGWLGNTVTHAIAPANRYDGNKLEAAWLPSEETALKWQEYSRTGKVSPIHRPNAVTNVHTNKISQTAVSIKWNYTPDLENGLPSFRIYRNSSVIHTLQGLNHDFGDTASSSNTTLEYLDWDTIPNSIYKIAAFNSAGESISQSSR